MEHRPPGLPPRPTMVRELAVLAGLAVVVALAVVRPFPLTTPTVYTQDLFQHLALVEATDWTGTPGATDRLAAPDGLVWSDVFPTGGDRLHLVALHALDGLTGDPFAAVNLYVVLGLVATILVTFVVLRWLGVAAVPAGVVAVVFALAPAMTHRLAAGHLFLFALFPVSLGVFLALWSTWREPEPGWWRTPRRWAGPLVVAAVVGTSSAYFAVFTVLVVMALAGVLAVRRASWRTLALPAAAAGAVVLVMGVSLAPQVLGGPAAARAAMERPVRDSDGYGLRVAEMILPSEEHVVPALASWGERAFWIPAPGDRGVSLGLLGVAGLAWVAAVSVRRAGRPRDDVDRLVLRLGTVAAGTIAIATTGGFGFVLATLGLTQIRAWSRMAPFVLLAALAGLALLAQRRFRGRANFTLWVVVLGLLATLDHGSGLPDAERAEREWREDSGVVRELEAVLPQGAAVAVLPEVSFPDDLGSDRLLALSSLGDRELRFSAGSFRGGPGDWQRTWWSGGPAGAARAAAVGGFDALAVQADHHLVERPRALIRDLGEATGAEAHRSSDGTWIWFDLRPLRRQLERRWGREHVERTGRAVTRGVGVTLEGSTGRVRWQGDRYFLSADAAVVLHRWDDDTSAVRVGVDLHAEPGTVVEVGSGAGRRRVTPGPTGERVWITVPMTGETVTVPIRSRGDALAGPPETDGTALVEIRDLRVVDVDLVDDPVLG